jgi:hypothetical protein
MSEKIYNPKVLTDQLQVAGLPVVSVSSTGRVDYARTLSKAEVIKAEDILKSHDPRPTDFELRVEQMQKVGITFEMLVLALWDQIIKGDDSAATALNEKMVEIDRINV